jgi:hypothetical protein
MAISEASQKVCEKNAANEAEIAGEKDAARRGIEWTATK